MNYSRTCIWCQEKFRDARIDQKFCSIRHRNPFNNNSYKERQSPYKKISDEVKNQDEIITAFNEYFS